LCFCILPQWQANQAQPKLFFKNYGMAVNYDLSHTGESRVLG